MSLVNDMLKDLEKRNAPERAAYALDGSESQRMIEPQKKIPFKLYSVLIFVIMVLGLCAYWLLMDKVASQPSLEKGLLAQTEERPEHTESVTSTEIASSKALQVKRAEIAAEPPVALSSIKAKKTDVKPVRKAKASTNNAEPEAISNLANTSKTLAKETRVKQATVKQQSAAKVKQSSVAKKQDQVLPGETRMQESGKEALSSKALVLSLSPSAQDIKAASEAISLFEVGKPEKAFALMKDFVANHKVKEKTEGLLASQLLADQRVEELALLFEAADKPLNAVLRQVKARWLMAQGEQALALSVLESALPDMEEIPEYFALLASLYQRSGQALKAFEQYSELIQSNETVADWWAGLGVSAEQLKQPRQAKFAYQQAVSLPGLNRALDRYIRQRLLALSSVK